MHLPDYEPYLRMTRIQHGVRRLHRRRLQIRAKPSHRPATKRRASPRTNSGAPTISPGRQLKGLTRKPARARDDHSATQPYMRHSKARPEHGTKPDFDIRLIPPYADDHSSCLAQAPSWISRLAAYGPGPSAWSPGSLAHPPHLMAPPLSRTIVVYSRRAQCASGS